MKKSFPFSFEFLYQVFSLIIIVIIVHAIYVAAARAITNGPHPAG